MEYTRFSGNGLVYMKIKPNLMNKLIATSVLGSAVYWKGFVFNLAGTGQLIKRFTSTKERLFRHVFWIRLLI